MKCLLIGGAILLVGGAYWLWHYATKSAWWIHYE